MEDTRPPNRRFTPEELQRIDAALERTGGHRRLAAEAIGMEPNRLIDAVNDNPILRTKWNNVHKDAVEPHLATEIHREKGLKALPLPEQEKAVAVAVEKQDALLHKGWAKLGFDGSERKFLAQLQATYARNFKGTMDLAYGGAAHANVRLLMALERVNDKIKDIQEHPEKYRVYGIAKSGGEILLKNEHDYLSDFTKLLTSVAGELRKAGDSAMKANELRLKVEKLYAQKDLAGPKKVAGWAAGSVEVGEKKSCP